MTPAGPGVYVYFRVPPAHEAAVVAALRQRHAAWRKEAPLVSCELLRRVEESDDGVTLMEVLRGAPLGELRRLVQEGAACLAAWPVGTRHVEVFEPCA